MAVSMNEVGSALRKEFAMEWGHQAVTIWTLVSMEEYRTKQEARYGEYEDYEIDTHTRMLDEGATHVARCVLGGWSLVDGSDVYLDLSGDECIFVSTPDQDYNGGPLDEAYTWVCNLAEPIESIVK